jgi:hypothetical protein
MVVGTVHQTNEDGALSIHKYINSKEIVVKFMGYDHEHTADSGNIRKGMVKNAMAPKILGVGFIGIGKHTTNDKKVSQTWRSMMQRCYSEAFHVLNPTYVGCTVCDDWLNFQNFADWLYETSDYEEGLYLDKDILVQGNKVYSPETCRFVSREVNNLVTDSGATRGKYKLGVSIDTYSGKYKAQCSSKGLGKKALGLHNTEQEAHDAYCDYKYSLIKDVALRQKDESVRNALLSRQIPEY